MGIGSFPFPYLFIPTPFHSHSQVGVLFPFPWDSQGIPIPTVKIPFPWTSLIMSNICASRSDSQLAIVGSPYWMAPECIAGRKYNEKVSILLHIYLFLFCFDIICFIVIVFYCTFSALTLLVGQQEGHLACNNWVARCWHGYLSGVRCRLAYVPADATATHCLLLQ